VRPRRKGLQESSHPLRGRFRLTDCKYHATSRPSFVCLCAYEPKTINTFDSVVSTESQQTSARGPIAMNEEQIRAAAHSKCEKIELGMIMGISEMHEWVIQIHSLRDMNSCVRGRCTKEDVKEIVIHRQSEAIRTE